MLFAILLRAKQRKRGIYIFEPKVVNISTRPTLNEEDIEAGENEISLQKEDEGNIDDNPEVDRKKAAKIIQKIDNVCLITFPIVCTIFIIGYIIQIIL